MSATMQHTLQTLHKERRKLVKLIESSKIPDELQTSVLSNLLTTILKFERAV